MFVDAIINGKVTKIMMVEIGATHNVCSENEAKRLSLSLHKDAWQMKVVNSKATHGGFGETSASQVGFLGGPYGFDRDFDG